MIKFFSILAALLGVSAIALAALLYNRRSAQLPAGQAGVAYVQNADGEFIQASDVRPLERTLPAKLDGVNGNSPTPDGSDEEWLTKFTLTERSGKQMGSAELKGQPYVAGFFFSSCPSICPKQNEKVRQLQDKFKGQAVRFVSISCDPEVDRPQVLSEYADRFGADKEQWLFFTGDFNYIRRVAAEVFRLGIERYAHPQKFAVMDADGKPFGFYAWDDANQWQTLQADLEKLIAAGGVLKEEK